MLMYVCTCLHVCGLYYIGIVFTRHQHHIKYFSLYAVRPLNPYSNRYEVHSNRYEVHSNRYEVHSCYL